MAQVAIKEVDAQGRIVIPKAWRTKHLRGKRVIMKLKEEAVEIVPYSALDLTKFFDRMSVEVKSDLRDWHALRRELRSR
jgi:bifunctional DNA-binding transcriptional regulator/antitoxin component of YhaV-PrlF toxin-antitoxin module